MLRAHRAGFGLTGNTLDGFRGGVGELLPGLPLLLCAGEPLLVLGLRGERLGLAHCDAEAAGPCRPSGLIVRVSSSPPSFFSFSPLVKQRLGDRQGQAAESRFDSRKGAFCRLAALLRQRRLLL